MPGPTNGPTVAIVGATGAVGVEMIRVLEQRGLRPGALRLLASPRSAGRSLPVHGSPVPVLPLEESSLLNWPGREPGRGPDVALFSAGSGVSKQWAPLAASRGSVVVDNSSAFRMEPGVPLVVPEVNPGALPAPRTPGAAGPGCIVANPNCSTIILLVALTPLHRRWGVARAVVSTYQAASGAGAQGMDELVSQTRAVLDGRPPEPRVFKEPYAFNLFSHNSGVDPDSGWNVEEHKMLAETRKMWADESVRISATCVRVPVLRAHCESVNVTLRRPATLREVAAVLAAAPGVRVIDDREGNSFPTPLKASGGDDVLVGRLRPDLSQAHPAGARQPDRLGRDEPTTGFEMFIAGDQLRKGAAQNAVQIAELVVPALRPGG